MQRKRAANGGPFLSCGQSVLLDRLEHLEDALRRTVEEALECLGQAAALQGVATDAFAFSHGKPPVSSRKLYPAGPQLRSRALPSTISAGARVPSSLTSSPFALASPLSKMPSKRAL